MTEHAKPGRHPGEPDFDLVEDIGDAAAFDRALDELLPRGDPGSGGRFDVDPADFEAFNRELDAQMAQAKARSARLETIEDLGTDVVEPPPARPAREPALAVPERIGIGIEELQVADDVVTIGTAAPTDTPAAPPTVPAVVAPPTPETASAPQAPAPAAAPAAPAGSPGRGATLAVLLGLGGLLAGAAGLWLSVDRQAELARLRSALAERQTAPAAPAVPGPSVDAEKVRALEGRLEEVTRRLAELSAAPTPADAPQKAPPADTHAAQREHAAAPAAEPPQPPAPETRQHAAAPAPAAPAAPKVEPKPAVKGPPKPVAAAADKPAAPQPPPASGPAAPTPTAATTASATPAVAAPSAESPPAASVPPAQTLPKPSGHGSWSVVIDSFKDESVAEQRSAQLARMGLPTEVRWYTANDQIRYRVVVPGYATRDAADAAAAELRRRKAGGAWVTRLPKQE